MKTIAMRRGSVMIVKLSGEWKPKREFDREREFNKERKPGEFRKRNNERNND